MVYHNDNKMLIDYFGISNFYFNDMIKKKIDVYCLYTKLKKCNSYGEQRTVFYNTLEVVYPLRRIEVLWTKYVNYRINIDEAELKKQTQFNKVQKKIKEDKKAGKII